MTLRAKAFRAVVWVALTVFSARIISFFAQLLLARIIAPAQFGAVAITYVVLASVQILQSSGLQQALVARKENVSEALNAAFFMSLGLGILFSGVTLLSASQVASFVNNAEVGPLLRLTSVILLASSLRTVPAALLEKNLRFRTLAWPNLLGSAAYGFVSIPLALTGLGAWSIVWGSIAQTALDTATVWVLAAWRPSLRFTLRDVRDLFHYGRHVLTVSFGAFLHSNLDTVVVSKTLEAAAVGYYNLSFNLGRALPMLLMSTVYPVLLPTYSQVQGDPERMAKLHVRLVKYVLLLASPLALVVALMARDGIMIFYGPVWQTTIVPLQIFCLYGLIAQVSTTNAPVLMVTRKLKEWNYIIYLNLILFLLLSVPAVRLGGLVGMSILMTLIVSLSCFLALFVNCHALGTPLRRYAILTIVPLGAAVASSTAEILSSYLLGLHIANYGREAFFMNVIILTIKTSIALATYAGVVYLWDADARQLITELLSHVSKGEMLKTLSYE
jgi:O-antigen/teichoic acid export membrane protein